MNNTSVGIVFIASLLAGCTTIPADEDPVLIKLTDLERRLIAIERVTNNDSLLDLASQVAELEAQVRALRGDVETVQFQAEDAGNRQRELYLDLDDRLAKLESNPGRVASSSTGSTGGNGAGSSGSDADAYQAALNQMRERQYADAAQSFKDFVSVYPESPLAGNAQYWLGESQYVMRQFQTALPEFEKVVDVYSESSKVPDALLKIGYCHYELGNRQSAMQAFRQAINDHPGTTAAGLASQRLERMRREGT
ncbi:MAG: tol-pal system protein YbgF [Pseudomonadota bacterium]